MLFKTCMSFLLLLNIKEDILKNVGDQMLVAIGLHNVFFFSSVQWTSMAISNCLVSHIFFQISFVFNKKEDHTGLESLKGE